MICGEEDIAQICNIIIFCKIISLIITQASVIKRVRGCIAHTTLYFLIENCIFHTLRANQKLTYVVIIKVYTVLWIS